MFQSDDPRMRPPPVVTTMGKLKQQYAEPDWCPPSQQRQQYQSQQHQQPRAQAESRDAYWGGNNDQGNSLLADDRDISIPASSFQYPVGRVQPLSLPVSPRQYQPQQNQMSSREVASYWMAIQAVTDSMNADGRGGVTTLGGLWKVFDAAVSELGTELSDSLSNKAIFEANVMQESLLQQGRKISEMEKKSNALSRRSQYESSLKSTMLRLRGSFADVILGTKKELQQSIDNSFTMKLAEMEQVHVKQLAEKDKSFAKKAAETEKKFLKKSIQAEESFIQRSAEMENSFAKRALEMEQLSAQRSAEAEETFMKKLENDRESANAEIERLHGELNQKSLRAQELSSTMESSEQTANMAQTQLAQERDNFRQTIANVEKSREDTVKKLSSTLETLQTMCASAHGLEMKLAETEEKVQQLQQGEQQLREDNAAANQQWSIANEKANILQDKLDSELMNKNALINVQKEMEKHLNLERERGDLLQQELESEARSKEEIMRSLQEADRRRRAEIDHVSQENMRLQEIDRQQRGELDHASRENGHLQEQVKSMQERVRENGNIQEQMKSMQEELDRTSLHARSMQEADTQRRDELDRAHRLNMNLQEQMKSFQETDEESKKMKTELDRVSEESANLQRQISSLQEADRQQREELERASEENLYLRGQLKVELDRASQEIVRLREQLKEANDTRASLKANLGGLQGKITDQTAALQVSRSECSQTSNALRATKSDYSQLLSDFQACKDRLEKTSEMSSLLEGKVDRLEAKVQDQIMDLEAARLSEAEVDKCLDESIQKVQQLDNELRRQRKEMQQKEEESETRLMQTVNEMNVITEQLNNECRQEGQRNAALEERLKQSTDEAQMTIEQLTAECRQKEEQVAELEEVLRRTSGKMQMTTDQLTAECCQKGEQVAALQKAENELTMFRDVNIRLGTERDALKGKLGAAEEDAGNLRKLNSGLEEKIQTLENQLGKVETDYSEDRDKIANALAGFEEEMSTAEEKLRGTLDELEKEKTKVKRLTEARKIAESAMTVEGKTLKLRMEEESEKHTRIMEEEMETLRQKMNEEKKIMGDEMKKMKVEIEKVKGECSTEVTKHQEECSIQVAKYQQDIEVYEEAIKMLQKQVDILQEMTDAECERCTAMASAAETEASRFGELVKEAKEEARQEFLTRLKTQKFEHESAMINKNAHIADLQEKHQAKEDSLEHETEESRYDELMKEAKEEVRQELLARINTQKLEHESAMIKKNAYIAGLQEKCQLREESMEQLCSKARQDLLHLKDQKKFLEGSLERSIKYIKDVTQSHEGSDAIELVATSLRSSEKGHNATLSGLGVRFHDDIMSDLDHICTPIIESTIASMVESTPDLTMLGLPKSVKDIGMDLDALLTCIEAQLGVGQCGAPKIQSLHNNGSDIQEGLLSAKSW